MDETNPIPTEERIIGVLRTCYDPEIPVNIYDMGMIYGIKVSPSGEVGIRMTLTSPNCPVAGSLPGYVESRVKTMPGAKDVKVELVWEPPWNPSMMSAAARLELGMDVDSFDSGGSDRLYNVSGRRT
jgi:FeS assembly SUF system protein